MSVTVINTLTHFPAPLREDLDLHPGPCDVNGAPTWLLHDPVRNRFFSIGRVEFLLLQHWGSIAVDELLNRINKKYSLAVTAEHVAELEQFLSLNQLLQISGKAALDRLARLAKSMRPGIGTWLLHHYLFFRIPLLRPDAFLGRTLPAVSFVFKRGFALLTLSVALLGIYLVTRQWEAFTNTFSYFFSLQGFSIYVIALFFSKLLHELGHAYTAKRYGLKVPTMGVAFLVMWPVLYTDTSEAWKLTAKKQRLAIGAAGMMAELALAACCTLAWSFLPEGAWKSAAFFLATASWTVTLFINANPFMRWDGYYLLSDILGIQNLQDRGFALARWKLREWLFKLDQEPPEQLPPKVLWKVLLYAYLTWIYRLVLFLGIALVVYHFFFKLAGLFLMLVEMAWFIARPVLRELKAWHRLRHSFSWNPRSYTTLLLVAGTVVFLAIPWNSHLAAPAQLSSAMHTRIFPPLAARIEEVGVVRGARVEAGDRLFILNSPDLEHRLSQARQRIERLRPQLSLQLSNRLMRDRRLVLERELAEAISEHEGLLEQQRRLTISAPFAGTVVDITDALTPGRWVPATLPLATLVAKRQLEINAYVKEDALSQIRQGDTARFYPDNLDEPPRNLVITEIDPTGIQTLDAPYLASVHDGPIAVHQQGDQLIPNESYYRIRLRLLEPGPPLPQISRGIVRINGQPRSMLERIWLTVGMIVVRESGF